MARVQYGVIVTEIKGAIGGSVFQGGNNSKVLRNKGYKAGVNSELRQAANKKISNASIVWRSLTVGQRNAWTAAALLWPFTDSFGNIYYGSGYQCFIAYNAGLQVIFESQVLTPNAPVSAEDAGTFVFAADDTNVMDVNWDTNTTVVQVFTIFMTAPSSAGKNGMNLKYKFISSGNTNGGTSGGCSAEYNAVYGGRQDGSTIYFYVEIRVVAYPRAVLRQYGSFVIV